MSLRSRLVAVALLVPMSGCVHKWEQVQSISPSELGAESRVRVTVEPDSVVELRDPIVGQDSISGTVVVEGCRPNPAFPPGTCHVSTAYELSALSKIETRKPDEFGTFAAVVLGPASVIAIIWFFKELNEVCPGPFECR